MSLEFTDEQNMLRESVRKMARERIAPRAAEIDATDEFPWDLIDFLREQGVLDMAVPEEYGGSGSGIVTLCVAAEEIAKASLSVSTMFMVQTIGGILVMRAAGTKEQQDWYFPQIIKDKKLGCLSVTEPEAGSDAASMRTKAKLNGDHYVVSGTKCFISLGGVADFFSLFAVTNPEEKHSGISAFIAEKGTPGFSIGKHEDEMGQRGTAMTELIFEDAVVPVKNRLGPEGEGFKIVVGVFNQARVLMAVEAVGVAQSAFDYSLNYAKGRICFGRPIIEFQGVQFQFADMITQVEAARCMVYKAARMIDEGSEIEMIPRFASMAKYLATKVAMAVTTEAVEILGGHGYSKDHPVERMMRDAKGIQIYEGPSNIQKMIIARSLMKS
ncbi:MAG: acyl-CoA dehydrogenase family protein [Pseudomonadota bacterium]